MERFFWRVILEFDEATAEADPDTEGDFGSVMSKVHSSVQAVPGVTITWDNIDPVEERGA